MPLDPSPSHRFCADPAAIGCSRELLALYESACHDPIDVFERRAVERLGRLVGFDGAVWGRGVPGAGGRGVQIQTATVLDRDERLLHDYAATEETDPVARHFFAYPDSVQSIDVGRFYRGHGLARIGDCLAAHDVSHVLLGGGRDPAPATGRELYSWVTAYRRDANLPFSPADGTRYAALLPHWVQAREICAELSRAREPWAAPLPASAPGSVATAAAASTAAAARPTVPGRGSLALSQREAEVLVYVSRGYSYVETAALMGISRATVHSHAGNLYGKLGVHSKTEAVFEARALGLLD